MHRWIFFLVALPAYAETPLQLDAKVKDAMTLCTDGKSHYVGIAREGEGSPLYYGDGKKMYHLAEQSRFLSPEWFFEPRFFNKKNNDNFRGIDWRLHSHVDYDAEKKSCAVTCGERTTDLKIVPPDEAKALVGKASFFVSPIERVPYALARDAKAVYYFVDRGATPATEKSFHLYRGPKGGMKLQKMTDVAADSEGEIFATKTGSLRLIIDKKQSSWIQGERATTLTLIPIEQNYQMIYNDLGVYTGIRLGTPCDDL
jgi:hypothetical protein